MISSHKISISHLALRDKIILSLCEETTNNFVFYDIIFVSIKVSYKKKLQDVFFVISKTILKVFLN